MRALVWALALLSPIRASAALVRAPVLERPAAVAPGTVARIPGVLAAPLSPSVGAALPASALFAPASFAAPRPVAAAAATPAAARTSPAASAQTPASSPAGDGKPAREVLHGLDELARLLPTRDEAAEEAFDGSAPRGAVPSVPSGARGVDVRPLRSGADIEFLAERFGRSARRLDDVRARLVRMLPFDAHVYRDARGDDFVGLDLSAHPDGLEFVPDLGRHEVVTIRKILSYTRDLQILIRERGPTPDLVVNGVVTEMKNVRLGSSLSEQLISANRQLVAHAGRHRLGRGAVVLDVVGGPKPSPRKIAREIARAVAGVPQVGFERVYVFFGPTPTVFARGGDGVFRADHAPPFARGVRPVDIAVSLNGFVTLDELVDELH